MSLFSLKILKSVSNTNSLLPREFSFFDSILFTVVLLTHLETAAIGVPEIVLCKDREVVSLVQLKIFYKLGL